MKNFVDRALETLSGKEKHLPRWHPRLSARVMESSPEIESAPFHQEYRMEIRAGSSIVCAPRDSTDAMAKMRKLLHAEVYGDLESMLQTVSMAVYEQDSDAAMDAIRAIQEYIRP